MRRFERLRRLVSGIRFRLTLWYTLVLSAVLLLFGVLLFVLETQIRQYTLDNRLTSQAHAFREGYNPQTSQIVFRDGLNPELRLADNQFLLLYNAPGDLVQQIGPLSAADTNWLGSNGLSLIRGATAETFFNYPNNDHPSATSPGISTISYRAIASTFLDGNTRVATLILGRPSDDNADLYRLALAYLWLAPLMIVITAGGAYWLAGRAIKPVRTITQAARTIEDTDLSRRLKLSGYDEIAELGQTFDGMLDRLESAFDRQRQFTRDASHELRTPLTIVQLEVDRALARPRRPEEYTQALGVIQSEAEYMARLVNNLLVLARADSGQAKLQRVRLDLSDLALEVVERLMPVAREHHIDLVVGALPELPVCGDRLYLTQMLVNLVENGIKYTCGVGHQVTVETGRASGLPIAWAKISDDGPGIAPEHLPHVFERFYRVDQARTATPKHGSSAENEHSGSGLGLSIVQWVARAHGGSVCAQSTSGTGTVFEIRLPLSENGSSVISSS